MSASPDAPSWSRGLSWNVAALAVAGLGALAANGVVAAGYGPAGLGVFSQTLTWFAFMAQFAAIGVHYAVLRQTALADGHGAARVVVEHAIPVVGVVATCVAAGSYLAAPLVGSAMGSPDLAAAIRVASVGLIVHAAAKVLAAGLNGAGRMGAFATVNAARGAAMLGAAIALTVIDAPLEYVGGILVASESAALIAGLAAWGGVRPRVDVAAGRALLSYGVRAAGAAVTVEINSRVDVAVLGAVSTDAVVGVYALAATAFEGVLQLFVVLRNQVNPSVSMAVHEGEPGVVDALRRKLWPTTVAGVALMLVTTAALLDPAVSALGLSPDFLAARAPLVILLLGLLVAAPWLPFDQLLVVGGHPGQQSRAVLLSVIVNLVGNLMLVPRFGGVGAALATAVAMVVLVLGVATRGARRTGTTVGLRHTARPPRPRS